MATEPKTIRETLILIQGVVDRLDLVQKITWAIVALLGTLIAGAAAIYLQLGDIRTDVAVLKTNISSLKEQLSAVQETLRSSAARTQLSLSSIESKLPTAVIGQNRDTVGTSPELNLSDSDLDLLRNVLKPIKTDKRQQTKIGDLLPDQDLRVLPRIVVEKIPRLVSYSYTYDDSGSLLLVSNFTRRIAQIVTPA
jgi:hypothetical protein